MRLSPCVREIGPQDLQIAARRRQFLDTGLVQDEVHERRSAPVHDRNFRRIQLDNDIVDAERRQRRQKVLDGLDRHGLPCQPGLVLNTAQMGDGRGNLQATKVRSLKPDAVVRRRRFERQSDLVA